MSKTKINIKMISTNWESMGSIFLIAIQCTNAEIEEASDTYYDFKVAKAARFAKDWT